MAHRSMAKGFAALSRLVLVSAFSSLAATPVVARAAIDWVSLGADDAHIIKLIMDDEGAPIMIGTDWGYRIRNGAAGWDVFEEPGAAGRAVHTAKVMHSTGGVLTGRVDADGHGYLERNDGAVQGQLVYSSTCGAFVDIVGSDYAYPGNMMWACARAGETPGELLRSLDLGQSWTIASGHGHQDLYDLVAIEWGPGGLLVAGDAGITYTQDGGQTWQDVSTGLPAVQVRHLWEMDPVTGLPTKSRLNFGVWACTNAGLFEGSHNPDTGVCNWNLTPLIGEPVLAVGFFTYSDDLFGTIALTDAGQLLVKTYWHDWVDLTAELAGMDILPVESVPVVATAHDGVWYLAGLPTPVAPPPELGRLALDAAPNPFNPVTTIRFEVPSAGHACLTVHDLAGRRVATLLDGEAAGGPGAVTWRPLDLSSGVYVARLVAGGRTAVQRLVLVR